MVVAVVAFTIFTEIFVRDVETDLVAHADMTIAAVRSGEWPGNFLFYALNALFSGFSTDARTVRASLVVVLTAAVVAKFFVTTNYLQSELPELSSLALRRVAIAAAFLLLFAFSLPTTTAYLGQIPTSIWHNSTVIVLTPLALLLFHLALRYTRTPSSSLVIWCVVVGALGVAAKPTYAMAFGASLPLFVIVRGLGWRLLGGSLVIAVALAVLVGLQYLYIYQFGSSADADSQVVIRPFDVWSTWSPSIPRSLLASVVFPLAGLVILRRRLWSYDAFGLALLVFVVATAMYALLAETGYRELHGNFTWQAYVAAFVLFLVVLTRALSLWSTGQLHRVEAVLLAIAFSAHVVGGVMFFRHLFEQGTVLY